MRGLRGKSYGILMPETGKTPLTWAADPHRAQIAQAMAPEPRVSISPYPSVLLNPCVSVFYYGLEKAYGHHWEATRR